MDLNELGSGGLGIASLLSLIELMMTVEPLIRGIHHLQEEIA